MTAMVVFSGIVIGFIIAMFVVALFMMVRFIIPDVYSDYKKMRRRKMIERGVVLNVFEQRLNLFISGDELDAFYRRPDSRTDYLPLRTEVVEWCNINTPGWEALTLFEPSTKGFGYVFFKTENDAIFFKTRWY